jgi:putative methionine-R-sulfoxide reductase with GAF domain
MVNPTELVGELQQMRDDGFLSDALLRHTVKTIAGADERAHWVGAFLVREEGEGLWLHNYVGEPAQFAEVEPGAGLWGTAASAKSNQNVPDVTVDEDYVACGPDVRSELVVLIRGGSDVFGGINLGSEDASAFGEEDEAAIQAVTDKLAEQIALERR